MTSGEVVTGKVPCFRITWRVTVTAFDDLCPLNTTFLIWNPRLLSWLPASPGASMNEGVGEREGKQTDGREGDRERQVGGRAGRGSWGSNYRNLQSSVMVQGAQGRLGRN